MKNNKVRAFALALAVMMLMSAVALAAVYTERYSDSNLRRGSGSDNSPELQYYVANFQEDLNDVGYDCGAADGIFGSKTEKAVNKFQKHFHQKKYKGTDDYIKKVDNIAGPNTKTVLYNHAN